MPLAALRMINKERVRLGYRELAPSEGADACISDLLEQLAKLRATPTPPPPKLFEGGAS